ncbi:MAG: dTDP-4-dehydrorhamnose 3,5-epimerase [Candidatus Dormibacteraeota bacterium]|nr:dTDP-4-dehydrorhamnose 3,5-epimerase [Candidatus Dormibacteraeota bacterium]
MRFTELGLRGAFIIDIERLADERGFFARCWSEEEFTRHGLRADLKECDLSYNSTRGTLRGLHYQVAPYEEAKLVRCTQGAIFDVIVDLRPASPTHMRWEAAELTAENRRQLYVPEGFAHGFQSLVDGSEVFYQMSQRYSADHARVLQWNEPRLAITWPLEPSIISRRDNDQ